MGRARFTTLIQPDGRFSVLETQAWTPVAENLAYREALRTINRLTAAAVQRSSATTEEVSR